MKIKSQQLSLLLLSATLPATGPLHAATKFWTGNVNGNFNNSGNWTPSGAPAAGDDLVFQVNSLVARLVVTNDFSPNRAFNSITFQGSNYVVRGSALLLTNGITSINASGPNTIDADVEVRTSQFWQATGALGVLDVNGDINLNAHTLTVRANTGDFFFSGIVSGTGNLVKTNVGTLRMDGAGHNTYTGFTRFDGGVLELARFSIIPASNYVAIAGDLTLGDGNGLIGTDVCRLLADDQIADTANVTVKNSALFDLNDHTDRIGSLTMQAGTIDTGTGKLFLGGNVTTLDDANTATINGNLSLGGVSRTFTINSGAAVPDLQINAVLSSDNASIFSASGFTKSGAGTLALAGANTYNGTTTVNAGQISVLNDRALGATSTILGGSAPTVVNGAGNVFLSSVQVTNEDLTINSSSASQALGASGASVWTGDILLSADTAITSSGSFLLSGAITGVGGFTKTGTGSLTLGGTNANTYTGTTIVRDGTLQLDKDPTDGAMSGPLVIGEDELPENTDIVRWLRCCQLPDDTDITINSSGLADLNGFGENVGDLIFNGGDLRTLAAGSILPTGGIIVNANTNSMAIVSGRLSVQSNPVIDVTGHFFSPDLLLDAVLHGAGGFTKNGPGEVGLTAANTFTGPVTVNDGFLLVDNSSALGTTAVGTVVKIGAVLALRFGVAIGAEGLTLAGAGQSTFGALSSSFGSNSWTGNITLSSNATVFVDAGDFLNLSGAISGSFNVTKTGAGTLIYSGASANTYGDTMVNQGALELQRSIANGAIGGGLTIGDGSGGTGADVVRLAAANQISDTTAISISSSGLLDLNDQPDTTGSISGSGRIDLGTGTLRAAADNASTNFSGLILGTGSMFKLGTGTWTLSGNSTYSGQTTVSAGTLQVNGSQAQSPVTVNGTANLGGTGVIGNLQVFGNLRPGVSPGVLTTSNVSFAAQGDYFVELNGPDPGTGYDQLNVRGTNQLGSSTLHLSVGAGFAPFEGEEFVILNNDGAEAIQGTFSGLPNGSVITANGLQFRIRYSDAFGNDVVLSLTNVAARLASVTVTGGNADGDIDRNECNFLTVVLTNTTGATLSGVAATLVPKTPGVSVTFGTSAYPTMAGGARGTNSTPFQFSTSPDFVCGTNVVFDLVVQTPANGSFTVPISLPSGGIGSAARFNNNTVTAIPDNGFVDIPTTVAGLTTPLKGVTVALHITHTSDSDLDISLIGPDGTTVDLSSDNGGTGDDYGTDCASDATRTVFSDAASNSITAGIAPFVGTFRPEQPLSVFNEKFGAAVNGIWRLRVADDTSGGVGSVRCWSLLLSPTACDDGGGACESCPEGRVLRGVLGTGSQLQDGRLNRNGTASGCGAAKACPGVLGAGVQRHFDAYTFENGESNACVTVTLEADCELFSASYLNAYDPANLCLNYLADAGTSLAGGARSYSFNVPAGARFVVVVNEVIAGTGCGYTLTVDGGSCRPRLNITPLSASLLDLDWTTAAIGFGLERTNVLRNGPTPPWVPVTNPPTISGGRFHVLQSSTPPPTNNFYRLRKP